MKTMVDSTPAIVEAGRVRRAWGAPLWAHAAALAIILVIAFPLMRPNSSFTTDEGAYALQVAALDRGSWEYDYKAAPLDPDGKSFPVVLSDRSPEGYFTYVKHPAYPLLLQASSAVFGRTLGLHLFGLLGVIGAAAAAWLLAGELDPRLRRSAFWLAAGGPVLVNGFLIWAHAPSAALAGLALVAAARIARRGVTPWAATGLAAALAGGVLLRSEGLLLAGAVAVTLAAVRFVQTRRPAAALGAFALAAAPAALVALAERRWISSIIGEAYAGVAGQGSEASSFLGGRLQAARHDLLEAHFINAVAGLPVIAALAVVAGLGYVALRRWAPGSPRKLRIMVAVAVTLLAVRYALHPFDPVTGLFSAWPIALLGLLLFPWRDRAPAARLLVGATGLFALAVLATNYPEGGGLEWGGRYFSPALVPMAVLAVAGLARAVDRAPEVERPRVVALLAVLGVASAMFALATAGTLRAREDNVIAAAARHPSPVTVTTYRALPRMSWRTHDRLTWMLTDDDKIAGLLQGLKAQGVPEVAVVVGDYVPLSSLSAYSTLQEVDEPALRENGLRMVIARS